MGYATKANGVAPTWVELTTISTTDYTPPTGFQIIGLYCGTAGNVSVVSGGTTMVIPAVATTYLMGDYSKVNTTSTTITSKLFALLV